MADTIRTSVHHDTDADPGAQIVRFPRYPAARVLRARRAKRTAAVLCAATVGCGLDAAVANNPWAALAFWALVFVSLLALDNYSEASRRR